VAEPAEPYTAVTTPEFVFGGKWAQYKSHTVETTDRPTDACHATTLLHLPRGEVIMAWFGGTYEGAEDVGIWISRRTGHGWDYPHLAAKVCFVVNPHAMGYLASVRVLGLEDGCVGIELTRSANERGGDAVDR